MKALSLTNGDLDWTVVDGIHSVAQRVLQRVQYWLGEWFLNTRSGVPYLADVFGFNQSEELIARTISDQIRAVPDVLAVENDRVSLDPKSRRMRYSARVRTRYGVLDLAGPVAEPPPSDAPAGTVPAARTSAWSAAFSEDFG